LPINFNGSPVKSVFRFDLAALAALVDRFAIFAEARTAFFEAGGLAATVRADLETFRADRGFGAADFFAEPFFFFGLAIA
jgi:hypothetical protein